MTALDKIASLQSQFSPNGQKIATLVLAQPELVVSLSSQELATAANVSQSSIVKFTQRVGFKGFPAFKMAISEELARHNTIGGNVLNQLPTQPETNNALDSSLSKMAQQKANAIIDTTKAIDVDLLKQIASILKSATRIQLIGLGSNALVAHDFNDKLLSLGLPVIHSADPSLQSTIAHTLTEQDVLFILSNNSEHQTLQLASHAAKLHGATIVVITTPDDLPLTSLADLTLLMHCEPSLHRIVNQPFTLHLAAQQTLTDILCLAIQE
ncbi:MurR/RpiR family transcriptional regulator [Photobacterium leiognathi]|uniref:MurR/RpiR family transcriptional regulator n=1 Tax=Photobacterium leiognathi TaxID=553611 RepID=UPI0029825CD6|nr:MurR/RpiR family transcriptional regulator [Photobacterium leiognathi]